LSLQRCAISGRGTPQISEQLLPLNRSTSPEEEAEKTLEGLRTKPLYKDFHVTRISGDPTQASRTWVLLTGAAEGGWGMLGTAFGREEFVVVAAKEKAQ